MIDTVRFYTYINDYEKGMIERVSTKTLRYDNKKQCTVYEFTNANLKGSYDTRIMLNTNGQIMIDEHKTKGENGEIREGKLYCKLIVECSLHKLLLGHNCFGGSCDLEAQIVYLLKIIFKVSGVYLDINKLWFTRIDVARVYKLDNYHQATNYIYQMQNVKLWSKLPIKYDHSIMFKMTDYSLKLYNKYVEYNKHDRKTKSTMEFYNYINGILRVEATYRKKKLVDILQNDLMLQDIDMKKLMDSLDDLIYRIEKFKGVGNMEKAKDYESVRNRIYDSCVNKDGETNTRRASSLLNSYVMIQTLGLVQAKNLLSKSTYYRHIKELQELNIDLVESNISLDNIKVLYPDDFNLSGKKYRVDVDLIDDYLKII